MINPHKIKYNKISSNELNVLDLIMCVAFDSDNGETSTFLNREAVASETHDGRYKRVARYKHNEVFSPKFTFMKKGFGDFTMEEVRMVLKWLTSLDTTSVLDVYYDDSEAVSWSAIGGWTEISTYKYANNRTVGITATFEAVTPYALSDLRRPDPITITSTNNKFTIEIDTDDNQPVYPRVTIQEKGTGVKFVNKHTDAFNRSTTYESIVLKNNTSGENIIVDGANQIITSSRKRIFGDDFNRNWLALYDGKNEITVEGNCTVILEYRTVIKCGEY